MRTFDNDHTRYVPLKEFTDIFQHCCFNLKMLDMTMEKDENGKDVYCIIVATSDESDGYKFIFETKSDDIDEFTQTVEMFQEQREDYEKAYAASSK